MSESATMNKIWAGYFVFACVCMRAKYCNPLDWRSKFQLLLSQAGREREKKREKDSFLYVTNVNSQLSLFTFTWKTFFSSLSLPCQVSSTVTWVNCHKIYQFNLPQWIVFLSCRWVTFNVSSSSSLHTLSRWFNLFNSFSLPLLTLSLYNWLCGFSNVL